MYLRFLRSVSIGALLLLVLFTTALPVSALSSLQRTLSLQSTKLAPPPQFTVKPHSTGVTLDQTVDALQTHLAYPPFILLNKHGSHSPDVAGFSADQLRKAYGIDHLGSKQQGTGIIAAVVVACGNPHAQADLNTYDQQFGLKSTTIKIVQPEGTPCSDQGWGIETDLDIQMVHAFAPKATIVLEEARSATFSDLLNAVQDAYTNQGATIVSMSFGGNEFSDETGASADGIFSAGNARGVSFFAASGDSGCGVQYPAASPFVTSVGGTSLRTQSDGTYISESAWNGSGGGTSAFENRPSYQNGFNSHSQRSIPDVAMVADPSTGVAMYDSDLGGFLVVGGTSVSTSLWAGVISDTQQTFQNVDNALYTVAGNPSKYASDFHDITTGSAGGVCSAGKGYDLVTGLGSGADKKLIPDLKGSPPPLTGSERLGGWNLSEFDHALSSAGDQVDTYSGNYSPTYKDISIPACGFPLLFTRTYNAQAASFKGPLGWGWTDSYNFVLAADGGGAGGMIVAQENGSTVDFKFNNGVYTAPPHAFVTLVHNQDGTFTFTRLQGQSHYTFNASGQLTKEVDRNGYATNLSYQNGKLMTVTDCTPSPDSRSLNFSYDPTNGLLSSVTTSVPHPPLPTPTLTVSFGYDSTTNDLTTVTDVNGGTTSFTYDAKHLLLTITDPRGGVFSTVSDSSNRVVLQTDAMGRKTTFSYGPNNVTTIMDPNGNVTVDAYTNALLASKTTGYGTPQAATWSYLYDPSTLGVTQSTDPNGGIWSNTWDSHGNKLSDKDPLGRTTTYAYDGMNDLLKAIYPNGEMTTYTYDSHGNLTTKSRKLGSSQSQTTTYIYDPAHPGNVREVIQPNQQGIRKNKLKCDSSPKHMHPWCYTYDEYCNRLSATDPLLDTKTYTYNGIGWKMTMKSPNGDITSYTYNNFGDVLTVTDPLNHTTTNVYDKNRNLVQVTDANGHTTGYTFDLDNEKTQVTRADGSVLTYSYDNDGNLTVQTDGSGNTTTYAFGDPAYPNKVTAITDALNRTTSYSYDGNGNRISLRDPALKVTSYSYDPANEQTDISYNNDPQTPNVHFTYDDNRNRISMSDGTGTTTYGYDALNRLTSSKTGAGNIVDYGYDLDNNLTNLTYPGGQQVTRTFDAANRLITVKDWLNNTTTFAYDKDGNMITETYPNGVVGTRQYDHDDRVTSIANTLGGSTLLSFAYTRDNLELLASLQTSGTPQGNETYGYTQLNQVSTVNSPMYQYDAGDNLTKNGSTTLSYDAADELTGLVNSSGTTTFSYDTQGNRTQQTAPGGAATTYTYDQANRLTAYSSGSTTTQYTYNGDGLRMSKTVAGTPEAFTWDLVEGMLLLQDGSTRYVYGPGGVPLEQVSGGTALYYLADQLGSTRALTNSTGGVVATYAYDAYGNVTGTTGSVTNPLQFAGQYTDAESGLIYLRARYYDPGTGQFLTRDPIVAQTQEAYGYAGGDPLNLTDPTGLHHSWKWWLGVALLVVGAVAVAVALVLAFPAIVVGLGIVSVGATTAAAVGVTATISGTAEVLALGGVLATSAGMFLLN